MMPRTAHGVAHDNPIGERTMIVRAMSPDREHFCTAAHYEDVFAPDMTQ